MIAPPTSRVRLTEALVSRHRAPVWRYLRMLGADPATADDLTQETFLRLLGRAPEDRGERELGAWLRRVAHNLFVSTRRRARGDLPLDAEQAELAFVAAEGEDSGASYRAALDECLRTLPERYREALVLRYQRGGSRGTVAAKLRLGAEGAKSLLQRARAKLHGCIRFRLRDEA